jgi:hypothetical protein
MQDIINPERRRAGMRYIESVLSDLSSGDDIEVAGTLPAIMHVCETLAASLAPTKDHEHFLLAVIESLAIALRSRLDPSTGAATRLH